MGIPGVQPQARLGRYELIAKLAIGGMGEIFLARLSGAEGFEKLYVVKRILPHLADDARFRQMLIAEARIASKMSHANICQVYELGETDGQLYIAMEYLEGVTLLPLLRKSSKESVHLDFGFIGGVIQQTCDALNYAHELKDRTGDNLGIIHRDVTPSNIFLTDSGIAKVLDFGIAKAKGASAKTEDGAVKGKYAYMAPEQLRGAAIDRRVDVFALGVVVYEMLALRRLFQRKTDYLTFRAVMEQPIPDIRRYRPDVPDALADALARALDREPGARWDTARMFGVALIDAVSAIKRPWTQGEIGDFVRANFADDIGKRSQQVTSAVHRTASEVGRSTMPLIAHDPEEHTDIDDDGDFPSVETDVDSQPPFQLPRQAVANPNEFQIGGTPPPFGIESTGSAPSLQPLRGAPVSPPSPTQIVVAQRRSLVWPMLAVAMVLVAGGALFLVWQQMQKQPQPTSVVIQQSPDDRAVVPPVAKDVPQPVDDDKPVGPDKPVKPVPHVRRPATYDEAIAAQKPAMVHCLNDHRDQIPTEEIKAMIKAGANGHAKTVSLKPDSLNVAPLGACLRNVLMAAPYPTAPKDEDFAVPLKPKTT